MKKIQLFLLVFTGFFLASCEKDQTTENTNQNEDFASYALLGETKGDILQNSENQLFIQTNYNDNQLNAGGATFDVTQTGISNIVDIDGHNIDFSNHEPLLNIGANINPELLPVLQTGTRQVTIELNGEPITGTIYNPEPVIIEGLTPPFIQISKNNGLTLNWIPDTNNGIDKIAISLINRGNIHSPNYTPLVRDSDVSLITEDDGQYTITSQEMEVAGFNIDDIIHIYLGRANVAAVGETAVVYYNTNFLAGKIIQ